MCRRGRVLSGPSGPGRVPEAQRQGQSWSPPPVVLVVVAHDVVGDRQRTGPMKVDSYSTSAQVPEVGSVWVWELGAAHARCLVRVVEVRWNGEEWWVKTEALAPEPLQTIGVVYN